MKEIHPNLGVVALAALAAWSALASGCSHNQTGITNPFLAPDRVPPPSTRVIAPGTALPYYQGDPLPVMQSATPAAPAAPAVATAAPAEPKQIAFSNEPSVAVPSDENSLRFGLPKPPEPTPVATVADAGNSPTATAAPAVSAQGAPTSAPTPAGVVPAIYNAPQVNGQPTGNIVPTSASAEPIVSSPWRSPQIPATTPPAGYVAVPQPFPTSPVVSPPLVGSPVVPPGYVVVPPMTVAPPNIDVTLRAVPSPTPDAVKSPTPRIRIPGYPAPPAAVTPASPTASGGSSDGFRPRSSMR